MIKPRSKIKDVTITIRVDSEFDEETRRWANFYGLTITDIYRNGAKNLVTEYRRLNGESILR
jgi:antitoxin component of RelBE/YafQ-DinJ toxin-antitoxin module